MDRYSGYIAMQQVKTGKLQLAFCWAHVRRDFARDGKGFPQLKAWALAGCGPSHDESCRPGRARASAWSRPPSVLIRSLGRSKRVGRAFGLGPTLTWPHKESSTGNRIFDMLSRAAGRIGRLAATIFPPPPPSLSPAYPSRPLMESLSQDSGKPTLYVRHSLFRLTCCLLVVGCIPGWSPAAEDGNPAAVEYFEKYIRPVLVEHCYECHSAKSESPKGGLNLDHRQGLLSGGNSGPAVVPGDPQASLLIGALRYQDFEMPPTGKLSDEVLSHFEHWIRQGAVDPRAPVDEPHKAQQPVVDANYWAFQPLQSIDLPSVRNQVAELSEIDRFVRAKLETRGLEPVAPADRRTLIRRAYFDLWGLPPEPLVVEQFVSDPSPTAFSQLVDRLLDSPHFGERWGRHWLDVARYGESTGHERNFLYPHAWRYRDYVIDAFNADKPYDRFVVEQIAGDLLPEDDATPRDERLIATGFLALGSRNLLGSDEGFIFDTIDDQINVTMQAISGLTVTCARCHDHKFDPISTKEYYALAGIFYSTETLYGTVPGTGGGNNRHPSPLVPVGEQAELRHAAYVAHQGLIAAATKELGLLENALKQLKSSPTDKLAQQPEELAAAQQRVDQAKSELAQLNRAAPRAPAYAMGVRDAAKVSDTQVRISGDVGKRGPQVPRGLLSCCTATELPEIPGHASGRLELAQWLVDPSHPLTARVMVNRVWQHLMGRGIVPSVDNFGHNGQPPSHLELLDWLAIDVQQHAWSIKYLIRQIMCSRTYQLSANYDESNFILDPENVLLWRQTPKRLEAEALRDSMLFVSGTLKAGSPEYGSLVARLGDGCLVRQIDAEQLKKDEGFRSVYLPAARYFEPEDLQVFDAASASLVVGDRPETNVPAQALYLLNNNFVIDQAYRTADKIIDKFPYAPTARIHYAFELVLGRPATAAEEQRALEYIHKWSPAEFEPRPSAATAEATRTSWAGFVQALFAGAEFRVVY